jgi:hypothetical protein
VCSRFHRDLSICRLPDVDIGQEKSLTRECLYRSIRWPTESLGRTASAAAKTEAQNSAPRVNTIESLRRSIRFRFWRAGTISGARDWPNVIWNKGTGT